MYGRARQMQLYRAARRRYWIGLGVLVLFALWLGLGLGGGSLLQWALPR